MQLYLRLGLKLKKDTSHIGNQSITMVKTIYWIWHTQKRIEAEINEDRDRKALYKLINNAIYSKTMENLRNRIDIELVNSQKDYLHKTDIETKLYVTQNIWLYFSQTM